MSQQIYDISRTLNSTLAVWPGDPAFAAPKISDIGRGEVTNVTHLQFSSHLGTHVDAPYHFVADGLTLDQLPLDIFIGRATVVTVTKEAGPLTPADLPAVDWATVERLVIHSAASHRPVDQFHETYVYPSPELADLMGHHQVVLFGTDAPSVDAFGGPNSLPSHHALQRNGIIILEGVMLAGVPDGEYELVALPLKWEGGDGCPVRAILRA